MSPTRSRLAILVLLTLSITVCVVGARADCDIDPLTLLPGDTVCTGVVRDGSPLTAYTYKELTVIINGAAALYDLMADGKVKQATVTKAIKDLGLDPEKADPLMA